MPEVFETPRAKQQAARLRGPHAKAYDLLLDDLQHRGCAAMGYRLTGEEPVPRLCVKHLRGTIRVVTAFETADRAWVLLVGPHDEHDPQIDVYTELWALLGVAVPVGERTKPPCCGSDNAAPVLEVQLANEIIYAVTKRRR